MSEYTPTTEIIRIDWISHRTKGAPMTRLETSAAFDRWLARYRESVIDEVEDHLVRRDQFTERTLTVIDELR